MGGVEKAFAAPVPRTRPRKKRFLFEDWKVFVDNQSGVAGLCRPGLVDGNQSLN